MMRIPSRHGIGHIGKLPVEPCVDDNGLPSHLNEYGQCIMASCDPGTASCGGWCVGCGPNATINLNDCGCDCLPGYVPVDLDTPGAGCIPTLDNTSAYWEGAPMARPPAGIAPPATNPTAPPGEQGAGAATGTAIGGAIAEDHSARNALVQVVMVGLAGYAIYRIVR